MRCPHCDKPAKSKVLLTRTGEGAVWRRRSCGFCFKTFVTREEAPAGLKMPGCVENAGRSAREPKLNPGQGKFQTDHLTGVW